MRKHMILATAMLTLAGAPAFAQTSPTPSNPNPAKPDAAMNSAAPAASGMAGQLSEQGSNQWLVSDVVGASVVGTDGKSIGEINDIVLEQAGTAHSAVIGVGGFLGVGEKNVAIPFSQLQIARDGDGDIEKVTVSMTKDDLNNAPAFQTLAEKKSNMKSASKPDTSGATTGSTRPAQ